MTKKILAIVLGLAVVFSAGSVWAQGTAHSNHDYDVTLESGCTVASVGATFGTHLLGSADLFGLWAGQVDITCSLGTTYMWGIDSGLHGGGGLRFMSDGTNNIFYNVYESAADIGNNGLQTLDPSFVVTCPWAGRGPYIASGLVESYGLTATVGINAATVANTYSDTVTVSVTWP